MKRMIITALSICLVICALTTTAAAERGPRLVDGADLLTASEEARILSSLDDISEKYEYDVVIVTQKSIGLKDEADFADDYYEYNGYGYGDDFTGLLLLITFDDEGGIWYISTCGEAMDAIDNYDVDAIGNAMSSDLSYGNYADAFDTFITECDYYINGHINGFPFNFGMNLAVSLVIGFIIAFIVTGVMRGKLKSVRYSQNASSYVKAGSMKVTVSRDFYLYRTVNRVAKPTSSSSGGHRSSSGRSHGGGGGRF